jgi:membrane protein DedA with SNARE-associated domain
MAGLGAILGAIVGFAIGILFVEVIFANNQSWPDVVPFVLAIVGALAGIQAVHWIRSRTSRPGLR